MRGPPRLRRRARLLIGENCIGKKQISLHSYEHESSSRDRSSCLRYTGVLTCAVLGRTRSAPPWVLRGTHSRGTHRELTGTHARRSELPINVDTNPLSFLGNTPHLPHKDDGHA